MKDTIELFNPDNSDPQEKDFGVGIPTIRWESRLCAVWVHNHRLVGLISTKSEEAARENKPFWIQKVCTWISQVQAMPTADGKTQIQSFRALTPYDNFPKPFDVLQVVQCHAITMAIDQPAVIQEWLVQSYKQVVLPSNIQLAQPKLPGV